MIITLTRFLGPKAASIKRIHVTEEHICDVLAQVPEHGDISAQKLAARLGKGVLNSSDWSALNVLAERHIVHWNMTNNQRGRGWKWAFYRVNQEELAAREALEDSIIEDAHNVKG